LDTIYGTESFVMDPMFLKKNRLKFLRCRRRDKHPRMMINALVVKAVVRFVRKAL
jgi:hypothetical protein